MKILCHRHGIQTPRRGHPRCPQCAREKWRGRKMTPKRKATMGIGKAGARYKHQREEYLAVGLTCERCGTVATEVHHRPGDRPQTPEWLDESRWTPVCQTCHAELEVELMTRAPDGTFTGKMGGG
jgi:hypothetical protein